MDTRALISAANRCAKLSRQFGEADSKFKRLMEERYGYHDEMPDDIVEVTQYGSKGEITLRWLDEEMTNAGYPPIKN